MLNRKAALALAVLAGLSARLLVLSELADHPLLKPAGGLDSGVYLDLARRVAAGDLLLRSVAGPFFVSPAYIYFTAPIVFFSGGSLFAVKLVQVLLGTVAIGLVADTARRIFDRRAAAPAAWLLALTGVVVFHETIFLQAAIDPFLTALALWLLVRALVREEAWSPFLWAGLATGILALNRPNVLPWVGVAALLIIAGRGLRRGVPSAAALALGAICGIAPATIRNVVVSGEPVLISSHGGLNLFIGNGPGADGMYRWIEGITPSIVGQAADARKVAESETGRPMTATEVSRHFARKAWTWIEEQPGAALRLFARKLWYTLSADEVPLNFSYPWYRGRSRLLEMLFVGPALLVPLGGVGLLLACLGAGRIPRRDACVWVSFGPTFLFLVAAFFVATRYRMPLLVILATAGGGALVAVTDALRSRDRRRLALCAAVALPLSIASLWPTGLDDGSAEEETQWVLHLVDGGERAEAARRAADLLKRHPLPGVFLFRLGQAWASAGSLDEAVDALQRSLAIDPHQVETERVLAAVLERRGVERTLAGNADQAASDLEAAVRLDPKSASARLNLAAVLAESGDRDRARSLAREALALRPGYERATALLAALGER